METMRVPEAPRTSPIVHSQDAWKSWLGTLRKGLGEKGFIRKFDRFLGGLFLMVRSE